MLIDWFTVGAQVLNFVLLVWLMKRFLYQPVLNAIAAREKRIADQITDAAAKEALATRERKTFEDKNAELDQRRAALLATATADAAAEGRRLLDAAQQAADALAAKRQRALASQAGHLQQLIAGRAVREVFAATRKTLDDLASVSLEERMVEVFARRLRELSGTDKAQLDAALKSSAGPALLRSHFELPDAQQAAIRNAINEAFSAEVPLRFDAAPGAVCGIEFSIGGQKLAWTIDAYLSDFEQSVAELVAPAEKPVAPVAPGRPDALKPERGPALQPNPLAARRAAPRADSERRALDVPQ